MQLSKLEWQRQPIHVWQIPRELANLSLCRLDVPMGAIAITDYIAIGCCLFSIWQIETVDGVDTLHLHTPPQLWQDTGDGTITVRDISQAQKTIE